MPVALVDGNLVTVSEEAAALVHVEAQAPTTITRAQLRLWLYNHGITWDQVLAWAQAQPPGPDRDRLLILLEDAIEFDRRDPRIRQAALALPLGLTEATVDAALEQAWREASGNG